MKSYKAVIIDDDINSIEMLKHFIKKYCRAIEVVGEAQTITEALSEITATEPDILFLDIQLNEGDAFDILDKIRTSNAQIIFITSYNDYAIKAFKYNAVDYLLKPIEIDELVLAVNKAIDNIKLKQHFDYHKIAALTNAISVKGEGSNDYVAIPAVDKIEVLKADDIIYIVADNKYTMVYTSDQKKHISSKNLLFFEESLDKTHFFRIHNTYIINVKYLARVVKSDGGYCEMITGESLPIAKRKAEEFGRFLKVRQ